MFPYSRKIRILVEQKIDLLLRRSRGQILRNSYKIPHYDSFSKEEFNSSLFSPLHGYARPKSSFIAGDFHRKELR